MNVLNRKELKEKYELKCSDPVLSKILKQLKENKKFVDLIKIKSGIFKITEDSFLIDKILESVKNIKSGRNLKYQDFISDLRIEAKDNNVIAFHTTKGGAGKTTNVVGLAKTLEKLNLKTLIIDFNPQISTTNYFLGSETQARDITSLLHSLKDGYDDVALKQEVQATILKESEAIDILPGSLKLRDLRTISSKSLKKITALIKKEYDFILIDMMPDWDNLTLNGYYASDLVICPSNVDILNFNELKYVLNQIEIEEIDIPVLVMLNRFNPSKSDNEELYSNQIFNHFKEDENISEILLKTIIPKSVGYEKMVADKEFSLTQQLFNPFIDLLKEIYLD